MAWNEIPGGFQSAEAGSITANSFIGQQIPSSADQVGLQVSVQDSQVVFIHAANPVDTGGSPVLIRASIRTDAPNAAVALAVLKGNLSTGEAVDGSIATNIPATASEFMLAESQMMLVYEPDTSNSITPVIQVAGSPGDAVTVFIDRLEIIKLSPDINYTGDLFGSSIGQGGTVNTPDNLQAQTVYEFDQLDLTGNGWAAIPGGFTGATAGKAVANSFVGQLIPSSGDNVGIQIAAGKDEVAFLYTTAPIQTNGLPLLIRATVRSDVAEAAVALAALKGNLSTGEGIDGTIATHIPATAASMNGQERTLVLVCPSNPSGMITPILQVAGSGDSTAHVFVDRMEIYRIETTAKLSGAEFLSQ